MVLYRREVSPKGLPFGGWSLSEKGGEAMSYITFQDLIQIAILVISIINLIHNLRK